MRSILLVDDDMTTRLVLSALFEEDGFAVVEASSFAAAREVIEGDSLSCDVILLDQHLGDGVGLDLVPLIRAKAPGARVILFSGDDYDATETQGVDHVAQKGLPFERLLALIHGKVV